jgi:hypothetical protein
MTNLSNHGLLRVASSFLILLVAFTAFGQASRKSRFDPDGAFWIHGDRPNEFSDFSGINLNAKRSKQLPAAGVDLINGKRFPFKVLSVKQESFTFTTVTVSGVSYSFAGRFLKGGVYQAGNLDDETPVLQGVLTKFKAGKKIAQAKLSFVYFGGT